MWAFLLAPAVAQPLPDTQPLTRDGDLAAAMVAGIDRYLTRAADAAPAARAKLWQPEFASPDAFAKSVQPQRERLKTILGVIDERVPFADLEYVGGPATPTLKGETERVKIYAVRWPALPGVEAEGLLLEPKGEVKANVIALPDADQTPEQFVGLVPGFAPASRFARHLAHSGCRVLVPALIDRRDDFSGNARLGRFTNQPHREFIYRMAYEMGRHVIGYELQKVFAAVDYFEKSAKELPIGVCGYGEGGLLALYAAALEPRIRSALVSGYFGPHETYWDEPIYRNVWGLWREFGDGEIAALVIPRALVIEGSKGPALKGPPQPRQGRGGAAPGKLVPTLVRPAAGELARPGFSEKLDLDERAAPAVMIASDDKPGSEKPFARFAKPLKCGYEADLTELPPLKNFDPAPRQKRQVEQLVNFTQKVWRDSDDTRRDFWAKVIKPKAPAATWDKQCQPLRDYFGKEVIGQLPPPSVKPNPQSRLLYDEPKWAGYEVTLDCQPDVFAYGILCVPKDLKPGERRPVVVCQHGLEGRPQDIVNPKQKTQYYNSFGAQLADLGYIVYAPQNPYIGKDAFRVLQRKANPLKLSLFSFIVQQHAVTLDWLATLPFVDGKKIGFYGLSYGGKTAMRVPALLPQYALSVCSGDFNEWVGKNVSADFRGSYMFTNEYEMPEFDLGRTFNYAEMAYLIAPRPFMVERGHDDGVGIDEMVASEYAKVRYLYAKLGLPQRTELEFFSGGHVINGKGTFAFLKQHLGWPK